MLAGAPRPVFRRDFENDGTHDQRADDERTD